MSVSTKDTFVPHSHIPYGERGTAFYSDSVIGCLNVVEQMKPLVLQALENTSYAPSSGAYTICDYGAADGGISMAIMHHCVEFIRKKHGDETEVSVIYEDQPVNDFKSLFLLMNGLLGSRRSYKQEFDKVFVSAVGTGFFDQCVPSNSVHLAFSSTAMHWLSKKPGSLHSAIHMTQSEASDPGTVAFSQQAATDWQTNLLHRAAELVPGGHLVVSCFTVDAEGQYLGNSKHIKHNMFAHMTALWRQLANEDRITQEEFRDTTFNNYYRSVEEYSAPFNDTQSPVYKAGLRLVSIDTKLVRCPYHVKWLATGDKDDPEATKKHAKWLLPTYRVWSNSTFMSGLSSSRSTEEREAIVDELFCRYERDIAAAPGDHGMDYVHAYMLVRKEACT